MKSVSILLLFAYVFLAACQQEVGRDEAINLADAYLSRELPQMNRNGYRVTVDDRDEIWRVTYQAPEGTAGGLLTVEVDKRTRHVGNLIGEQ